MNPIILNFSELILLILVINSALFAGLQSMSEIFKKNKNANLILFQSSLLFPQLLYFLKLINYFPYDHTLIFLSLIFLGISSWFYFMSVLNPQMYFVHLFLKHYCTPLIILIFYFIKDYYFPYLFNSQKTSMFLGMTYLSVYLMRIEYSLIKYWKQRFNKLTSILILLIICDLLSFGIFISFATFLNSQFLIFGHIILACVIVFLFLIQNKLPIEVIEASGGKYLKSKLKNIPVDQKINDLNILINTEKIFLNETLSLQDIANLLELSVQQTSELINSHWHLSFNQFLNTFRIEYASKILILEKEASILSIAFQSGFANKSSFNNAFLKFKGVSPSTFRKQEHHKK